MTAAMGGSIRSMIGKLKNRTRQETGGEKIDPRLEKRLSETANQHVGGLKDEPCY
jgi:hypothetical protein